MKGKLLICLFVALLCTTLETRAGFVIHRSAAIPAKTEATSKSGSEVVGATEPGEVTAPVTTAVETKKVSKHHGFISKVFHFIAKAKEEIPQILYIVLAVFFLGWLAMGINDNFEGYDWAISLILYLLLWLPGFIYTLIKMSNYY